MTRHPFSKILCLFSMFAAFSASASELRLTEAEFVKRVLEQNLHIKQSELDVDIASEALRGVKGRFDTMLSLEAAHNVDQFRRTSTFFGNRTDTTSWNASLTKQIPTGTFADISFDNVRQKTFGAAVIGGSPVISTDPLYEPQLTFSLTQSLLQNAVGLDDRRVVKSAKLSFEASDFQTQRQIQTILFQSLSHFWSARVAAEQLLAVKGSVKDAKQFLATTREKRRLGTAEQTDVLAAEANLLRREGEALALEAELHQVETLVRQDLALGPEVTLLLEGDPKAVSFVRHERDESMRVAFIQRPDYQGAKKRLERQNVELAMAKMSRWPKLDLVGSLALNEIDTSYEKAASGINNTNWTIGVNFSLPLENRRARAEAKRVNAERRKTLFQLKSIELQIENEVMRLHGDVVSRKEGVEKLLRAKVLEERKLKQELRKYQQGRSSAETIIRFQDDLLQARLRLLNAQKIYVTSVSELKLAEGSITLWE